MLIDLIILHHMKIKTIIQTLKIIKCLTFHTFLNDMLTNLYFTVHIGASQSSTKQLNNGLLQGSVIASTQITCTLVIYRIQPCEH